MKDFKSTIKIIYREHRSLFVWMLMLLTISVIFLVYSLVTLSPGMPTINVGYGDIGSYQGGAWSEIYEAVGYRPGSWVLMMAFPILALILGGLHNLIALKLYKQKGDGVTKIFVIASFFVALGGIIVLSRLLGER